MKFGYLFIFLFLLVWSYLLFFPVPVSPATWEAPEAPDLAGPYAVNEQLKNVERLFEGQCPQCEDVAIDRKGNLYGGAADGRILRFAGPDATAGEVFARTGGRPLGLDFDRLGNLVVADAYKGLLSIDPAGRVDTLSTAFGGLAFRFTDDLEVDTNGIIYFSDASWKFTLEEYKYDIVEHRPHGRLLAYDPTTRKTELLLDSLYFANGVAVSHDQSFVLVNETSAYRVRRYWLRGPKAGQSDILIDNLPGFPDGISQGSDGIFWLTLVSPRNSGLDDLMGMPRLRKVLIRLPKFLQPVAEHYGFILGVNAAGEIVYNYQDPKGTFAQITSVQEANGWLYLGSLHETSIGRFKPVSQ